MAIRIRDDEDEILAQINIIPLVDVSLVLLIIFIATVNHILTPSIRIKLPEAVYTANTVEDEGISISISSEGIMYLGKDIVTLKELRSGVEELHKSKPDAGVILHIDKSVHFQRVVDALDVVNGLGISKLDIRTLSD